jgi:hypothetical protein
LSQLNVCLLRTKTLDSVALLPLLPSASWPCSGGSRLRRQINLASISECLAVRLFDFGSPAPSYMAAPAAIALIYGGST